MVFSVNEPTDCRLLRVGAAVDDCEVMAVRPVTSIMLMVAPPVSVRIRFSTADTFGRIVTAVTDAVRVSLPSPPVRLSKVFQLLAMLASIVESEALPAKLTVSVPILNAAAVTSAVVDVSLTVTVAVLPRAFKVIVLASVNASATSETVTTAEPSIPIVAVPDNVPPVTSAASTPPIE